MEIEIETLEKKEEKNIKTSECVSIYTNEMHQTLIITELSRQTHGSNHDTWRGKKNKPSCDEWKAFHSIPFFHRKNVYMNLLYEFRVSITIYMCSTER